MLALMKQHLKSSAMFLEKKKNKKYPTIPYYAAQNDTVWAGGYHRPRLAFGPFNSMLAEHC
jgi:hypothetical protein